MMKKPLLKSLLSASLFSTLVFSAHTTALESLDKIVAVVDDDVVLESEYQRRIGMVKENIANAGKPAPPEDVLRKELLDLMIVESIQLQMAQRAGIRISDAELNNAINNIAQRNGLSIQQFKELMESKGQSYLAFREQIRRDMLLQTVQNSQVGRRVRISEREIDNFLASEEGQSSTSPEYLVYHTLVPTQSNDAEAKAFADKLYEAIQGGADYKNIAQQFTEHPANDSSLGWRRLQQLPTLLIDRVPDLEKGQTLEPFKSPSGYHLITLSDQRGVSEMVKQTRVRHILLKESAIRDNAATKAELEKIRQRIIDGEDFTELAREFSEDIGSAQEGGSLGWAFPGQMVPAFENTMSTAEIGQLSPVFQSKFGWHVLEVLERKEKDMSEELRRRKAQNILYERKFDQEQEAWMQKIRDEAFISIK